jgi:hypothetical protein
MVTTYSIDTCVIVFANREMPRDIHRSLWDALENLIRNDRAFMHREAYEELKRVDDECAPWANTFGNFIQEVTEAEMSLVQRIGTVHPQWVRETANAADPFIIAHACIGSHVVVTQERAKGPGVIDKNLKIPNVCQELNIPCINLNSLARGEGWQF